MSLVYSTSNFFSTPMLPSCQSIILSLFLPQIFPSQFMSVLLLIFSTSPPPSPSRSFSQSFHTSDFSILVYINPSSSNLFYLSSFLSSVNHSHSLSLPQIILPSSVYPANLFYLSSFLLSVDHSHSLSLQFFPFQFMSILPLIFSASALLFLSRSFSVFPYNNLFHSSSCLPQSTPTSFPPPPGFETVRSLAYHGCTVVIACRDVVRGEEAASRIYKQRPNASLHPMALDLTSLASVKTFAQAFAVRFG